MKTAHIHIFCQKQADEKLSCYKMLIALCIYLIRLLLFIIIMYSGDDDGLFITLVPTLVTQF